MTRTFGFAPRSERLAALQTRQFDLLVVGGGITGAAVARDAAARGLSTAIVEREDWASGTSSRSSKLVHGGLRYLRNGQFRLVFESLAERDRLQRLAPHLVRPLDFLFPTYRGRGLGSALLAIGLTAYDLLALGRPGRRHRCLSRRQLVARERLLETPELAAGAAGGSDCRTDDARLTLENVLDAAALGAVAVSRVELLGLERNSGGRIRSAGARDRETGGVLQIRARIVVNATGPWADGVRRLEEPGAPALLRLSRGAHVAFPVRRLPLKSAVAFPMEDGRLLFAIPCNGVTLLGTTENDHSGPVDDVAAQPGEIEYLLAAAAKTFPSAHLTAADAVATFAALRPLVKDLGRPLGKTSREETIQFSDSGLMTVAGGKLTTHRLMGARAVDAAAPRLAEQGRPVTPCATETRPLPGAPVRPLRDFVAAFERACAEFGIPPESARHVAFRYGRRAEDVLALIAAQTSLRERLCEGVPDLAAEIVFAARAEDARSISDALIRRTHLFWQAPRQGTAALDRVGAILSRELGWNRAQEQAARDDFLREVECSRGALGSGG